jgi:hypothetical protein
MRRGLNSRSVQRGGRGGTKGVVVWEVGRIKRLVGDVEAIQIQRQRAAAVQGNAEKYAIDVAAMKWMMKKK